MGKRRDLRCVFWLDDRKEKAFYILVLFSRFALGVLVLFWEFVVRLLFKGSGYKGLGLSGRGVEP